MRERTAWYRRIQQEESTQNIQYRVVTISDENPERVGWALNYISTGASNVEGVLGFGTGFFGPYMKAYEVASYLGMPDLRKAVAADLTKKLSPVAAILQLEQNYLEIRDEGLVRHCGLTSSEFYGDFIAAVRSEYHRHHHHHHHHHHDNGHGHTAMPSPPLGNDPLRTALVEFGARTYHICITDVKFKRDLDMLPEFATDLRRKRWLVFIDKPYSVNRSCLVCSEWLFEGGERHIARAKPGKGDKGFVCSECVEQGRFARGEAKASEDVDVVMG
ncbi:naked cuticle [Microdochium nivale]|nr:naked cuticle [Microdochium nivale]